MVTGHPFLAPFRHLCRSCSVFHRPILRLFLRDMARGVEAVAPLPKVSFVKVDDDTLSKPAGVGDNTARGFGCEFCGLAGFKRSHAFVPQITMGPNSRDQTITFGTAVSLFGGKFGTSRTCFQSHWRRN